MIRIEIETENDAFKGGTKTLFLHHELKRIFNRILRQVLDCETSGKIMDENGNTVGKWEDS